MTLTHFLELRDMLSIAHHIPGRLRLKIDPRIREHPAATALLNLGKQYDNPGVLSIRINPIARSLVLEYDIHKISPNELEEFLSSSDTNRVSELATTMAKIFGVHLQL